MLGQDIFIQQICICVKPLHYLLEEKTLFGLQQGQPFTYMMIVGIDLIEKKSVEMSLRS